MLAHRVCYHCNYAMGKYKYKCVCVRVCVRVYLVGLPLMVMVFASSTVISADLWISFFGWSGLCTAHPVP